MGFIDFWCGRCERDALHRKTEDGADGCPILAASFAFDIDHPEYPKEWVHDDDGQPCCTAFTPELTDEQRANAPAPRCDQTIDMFDEVKGG